MGEIKELKQVLQTTVNSNKYKIHNTVNSNDPLVNKISNFIETENIEPEGVAQLLAELLNDKRSLKYYLLLVNEHTSAVLIDLAYQTREKYQLGLIRTNMPIYFIGALKRQGFKTKFR